MSVDWHVYIYDSFLIQLGHHISVVRLHPPRHPDHSCLIHTYRIWRVKVFSRAPGFLNLPAELQDCVFSQVEDVHLGLQELQPKLMKERKDFVTRHDEEPKQHPIPIVRWYLKLTGES